VCLEVGYDDLLKTISQSQYCSEIEYYLLEIECLVCGDIGHDPWWIVRSHSADRERGQ